MPGGAKRVGSSTVEWGRPCSAAMQGKEAEKVEEVEGREAHACHPKLHLGKQKLGPPLFLNGKQCQKVPA